MSLTVQDILDMVRDHEAVRWIDWSKIEVRSGETHRFETAELYLGAISPSLELGPVPHIWTGGDE